MKSMFDVRRASVRHRDELPGGVRQVVGEPQPSLLFLPIGMTALWCVLGNKVLAEDITNVHAFMVIAPNHTADDLYRFFFHYHRKRSSA